MATQTGIRGSGSSPLRLCHACRSCASHPLTAVVLQADAAWVRAVVTDMTGMSERPPRPMRRTRAEVGRVVRPS
jgi:hypothetical protein